VVTTWPSSCTSCSDTSAPDAATSKDIRISRTGPYAAIRLPSYTSNGVSLGRAVHSWGVYVTRKPPSPAAGGGGEAGGEGGRGGAEGGDGGGGGAGSEAAYPVMPYLRLAMSRRSTRVSRERELPSRQCGLQLHRIGAVRVGERRAPASRTPCDEELPEE
jgi:hypothetical protein